MKIGTNKLSLEPKEMKMDLKGTFDNLKNKKMPQLKMHKCKLLANKGKRRY